MSIKMRIGPRSYRIEIGVLIRKESEDVEDFSSHAAVLEIAQGVEIRSRLRLHRHLKKRDSNSVSHIQVESIKDVL